MESSINTSSSTQPSRDAILAQLQLILAELTADHAWAPGEIGCELSLTDDLGLDSLKFVDLMAAIETRFGIEEFPMQAWVDHELEREGVRFTLRALLDACAQLIAVRSS